MTLSVTTFVYDPVTLEIGSATVRALGAQFLPRLARGDLVVYRDELEGFEAECRALLSNLELIRAREGWRAQYVAHLLQNLLKAAEHARSVSGGLLVS